MSDHAEAAMVRGLYDHFHGLYSRPCTAAAIRKERLCRLVEGVGVLSPDEFDCSYKDWTSMFRSAVRQAAEDGWPDVGNPSLPAEDRLAKDSASRLLGKRD
jgi:hypothetical protein